ncbi:MAG: alpha/beta hydrolase [Labilithrix sp.]|nr:alpha/beta hydrolase [Labilithrix sp.]MCW5834362.1 alpha/beta hydrolase [Labilithrix sp.]
MQLRSPRALHVVLCALALALGPAACASSSAPASNPAGASAPSGAASPTPPAPRVSRVRSADGVELAVTETGDLDGPAIVFVHGLGFSREIWRRQLEGGLSSRFHLVAYDLRGHGRSARPRDDAAYADGARWGDDLAAVIAGTRVEKPIVVGWSLGGVVLGAYLRDHGGDELGGAVFVDAVTKFAPELFAPGNDRFMAGLGSSDDAARAEWTRAFVEACFAKPLDPGELDRLLAAAGVLPASEHVAIQRISLAGTEPALRAFQKPTLVVYGAFDRFITVAMARHTAELVPGARLVQYERAGHAPFVDEAARFDEELARFVLAARTGR